MLREVLRRPVPPAHERCLMPVPLSILDLATAARDQTMAQALEGTVALAQKAEETGYERVWYAEHHNMSSIGSSATSVLIAHVAAHTRTIRLGAGGIMLPNHAPLVIAEQFGTLETLHPGRIDLGLGRAPGTDQNTMRALRRGGAKADTFPEDVMELQAYLQGQSRIPGVNAYPGKGTDVPLYILGSSLFGAGLAAALGLPYAFASHFSPGALHDAIALYRREFTPSEQLEAPHVIAGYNVIAADDQADAERQQHEMMRSRVALLLQPGTEYTDEQADELLAAPQAQHLHQMATYSAIGTPDLVRDQVTEFAEQTGADELIVAHQGPRVEQRLRSAELLAEAYLS